MHNISEYLLHWPSVIVLLWKKSLSSYKIRLRYGASLPNFPSRWHDAETDFESHDRLNPLPQPPKLKLALKSNMEKQHSVCQNENPAARYSPHTERLPDLSSEPSNLLRSNIGSNLENNTTQLGENTIRYVNSLQPPFPDFKHVSFPPSCLVSLPSPNTQPGPHSHRRSSGTRAAAPNACTRQRGTWLFPFQTHLKHRRWRRWR